MHSFTYTGWLKNMGMQDMESTCSVHLVGAAFGLAGALALGPRIGVFTPKGRCASILFEIQKRSLCLG